MPLQQQPRFRTVQSGIAALAALLLMGVGLLGEAAGMRVHDTPVSEKLAAAHFVEPLVATVRTTAAEDRELLRAIAAYERRGNADDFRSLTGFWPLTRVPAGECRC